MEPFRIELSISPPPSPRRRRSRYILFNVTAPRKNIPKGSALRASLCRHRSNVSFFLSFSFPLSPCFLYSLDGRRHQFIGVAIAIGKSSLKKPLSLSPPPCVSLTLSLSLSAYLVGPFACSTTFTRIFYYAMLEIHF
jgi:hypothetical protein